jgi:hypothetical protein
MECREHSELSELLKVSNFPLQVSEADSELLGDVAVEDLFHF